MITLEKIARVNKKHKEKKEDLVGSRLKDAYTGAFIGGLGAEALKNKGIKGINTFNSARDAILYGSLIGGAYNGYKGDSNIGDAIKGGAINMSIPGAALGAIKSVSEAGPTAKQKAGALLLGAGLGSIGGSLIGAAGAGIGHAAGAGVKYIKDKITD